MKDEATNCSNFAHDHSEENILLKSTVQVRQFMEGKNIFILFCISLWMEEEHVPCGHYYLFGREKCIIYWGTEFEYTIPHLFILRVEL